jgi:hypothetical protein
MSEPTEVIPPIPAPAAVAQQVAQAPEPPLEPVAPDPLAELSGEEKVERMATDVLTEEKATTSDKPLSGKEIFDKAKAKFPTAEVPWNTFKQYLSRSVSNPRSQINSLGRKGYYLSAAAKALDPAAAEPIDEPQAKVDEGRREKEKLLYPVLLNWLIEQEYRAKITATGRANGWWGNPDITGIICDESFGNLTLEVATIEVKLSEKSWKQWIFEAISHRRFANRSYFAFAYPSELIKKLDSELRYFSELYHIGVLVIGMDQAKFDDLQSGKLAEPIEDDDVDIIELYSAPYSPVQPRFQKDYLQSLKITSTPEVARWGQGLDENE